jgi:hypothetical protein
MRTKVNNLEKITVSEFLVQSAPCFLSILLMALLISFKSAPGIHISEGEAAAANDEEIQSLQER